MCRSLIRSEGHFARIFLIDNVLNGVCGRIRYGLSALYAHFVRLRVASQRWNDLKQGGNFRKSWRTRTFPSRSKILVQIAVGRVFIPHIRRYARWHKLVGPTQYTSIGLSVDPREPGLQVLTAPALRPVAAGTAPGCRVGHRPLHKTPAAAGNACQRRAHSPSLALTPLPWCFATSPRASR